MELMPFLNELSYDRDIEGTSLGALMKYKVNCIGAKLFASSKQARFHPVHTTAQMNSFNEFRGIHRT